MDKVVFLNQPGKTYNCFIYEISANVVSLSFADDKPTDLTVATGFYIANENNGENMSGDLYYGYTTIWKKDGNEVDLSNDGSTYVEPAILQVDYEFKVNWSDSNDQDGIRPDSVDLVVCYADKEETLTFNADNNWSATLTTDVNTIFTFKEKTIDGYITAFGVLMATFTHTTLAETKTNKIAELKTSCSNTLEYGADVKLSDDKVEHFNFSTTVQSNLENAYNTAFALISIGQNELKIPFYDSNNNCQMFLPNDIMRVYLSCGYLKTYTITLLHQLEDQIGTMTDIDSINAIQYNIESLDTAHAETFNSILTYTENVIKILGGE